MIGFRFRTNVRECSAWLEALATEQVPFAAARALTQVAQDAQADVRTGLPRRFEIRSSWTAGGIRIVPASKRDWPRMASMVGSRDEFLAQHEEGGAKRAQKGARNVAIPTKATTRNRGAGGRLPRTKKPRALRERSDVFVTDGKLRQRIRGGRKRRSSGAETLTLFLFRPVVKIRPRLGLREVVEATVQRTYGRRFKESLESAIKAPKRPGKLT